MLTVGTDNEGAREAWLKRSLQRIPAGSRILDAGAGELQFKKYCAHLDYVSQDFARYDGKGDGAGLHTGEWKHTDLDIVSEITSIPEPDHSFDAIMCIEVFEHLPDPLLAVREFSRLLKKDGYLIITAPFCSLTHFAPYHYFSGFNSYFYAKHLHDHRFAALEMTSNGNFFEVVAQELRRLDYVAERHARGRISFLERQCLKVVLAMLQRFSAGDTGSSELLCHGYNIICKKL